MSIRYHARGAASAEAAREKMRRTGENFSGEKLWTRREDEMLAELYPDYQKAVAALGRSYNAVKYRARHLGLTPVRARWTAEMRSRLRKVYSTGSRQAIQAEFPTLDFDMVCAKARYFGFRRQRRSFTPTGQLVLDQIRSRCFELNLSMGDLDAMAGTGHYFLKAAWLTGGVNGKAIARAVQALDGELFVKWRDDDEVPLSAASRAERSLSRRPLV